MHEPSGQRMLELKNVSKRFGRQLVVDTVSLEVNKGEIYGFLGPNGAGKSTTIRMILDILRPTSGTITALTIDSKHVKEIHHRIGYLSGDMAFDDDLTGKQYLNFVHNVYGSQHADRTQELSERLQARLDTKIGNLSRGNRQKIGLIAALLHEPELLILDEPTSGFDPLVQETFISLMREYAANGGTVFMSSHILSEVQVLCDRAAFIRDGKIVDVRSMDELRTAAKRIEVAADTKVRKAVLAGAGHLADLQLLAEHDDIVEFTYSGTTQKLLAHFAKYDLRDITIREPELEEIFGHYYETRKTEEKAHA